MTKANQIIDEAWRSFDRWLRLQPCDTQDQTILEQIDLYYQDWLSKSSVLKKGTSGKTTMAKTYFTGKPCKNGHLAPRYEANGHCTECVSNRTRSEYEANPEFYRERARANNQRRQELQNWTITQINESETIREMAAHYDIHPGSCPKCGVIDRLYRHGTKQVQYTDAPSWGKQSILAVEVRRYRCRDCGATSMQPLPDMDSRRMMTKRCVEYIERQGVPQTYATLARHIGVDEKTIRNICNLKFERQMAERQIRAPLILGIDELTLLGRKRTIFVDVGGKRLLDLIDSMNRSRVDRWLYNLPEAERVLAVTIDMWGPYKASVRKHLPNARIIVDKWHILSKVNQALDRARNRARRLAGIRKNPQKGRRLLQMSRHKLSTRARETLDALLAKNPIVAAAWKAKESFYDIFAVKDRSKAESLFEEWRSSIPTIVKEEFEPVAKTVDNWHTEIFAFFDYPLTNAYTEARNGLIKIANRAGRGYSFDTIRAKALLMQSSEEMKKCPACGGFYPKSASKPVTAWIGSEGVSHEICANCHYYFHIHVAPIFKMISPSVPTPFSG